MTPPLIKRIIAVIIGVCVVVFLIFYFMFNLAEEHIILKILLSMVGIALLMLIPNTLINGEHSSLGLLLRATTWLFMIFIAYMFLYFNYWWWIRNVAVKFGIIEQWKGNSNEKQK